MFIFYNLLINEEISNLKSNYQADFFDKLSHFILDIIKKLNISNASIQILSLFYNLKLFKNIIFPSIKNLPLYDYEILLYSHKFAVISSMSNNNSFYSKIIFPQILENIKNKFTPGGEPNDSLKIESGNKIKKLFERNEVKGVYICSCNYFYIIEECGKPYEKSTYKNCGELIGGERHYMVKRHGHVRIVNDKAKWKEMMDNGYDEFKYLSKLMEEVEKEKKILILKDLKKLNINFL